MDRQTKILMIFGQSLMSLVFAATSPIIHVHFINLIGPRVLAASDIISVGLAAIVNSTIPNDKMKNLYRRNFKNIVVVDIVCFALVSFAGVEQPELRFLGFAVVNSVSTTLWAVIMSNAVNLKISGDTLTDWESFSKSFCLYASLIGGIFALFVTNIPVELCISAQCIANLIFGITDLKAFKRLNEGEI